MGDEMRSTDEIKDHLQWDVTPYPALQAAVRAILMRPLAFEWTTQGFGMLRTYLDADKIYRLNVWHSALAKPGVSTIHDHPWDFKSWIMKGRMINRRYEISEREDKHSKLHEFMVIKTGEGGGPDGDRGYRYLKAFGPEVLVPPHCYLQVANEIHHTLYDDGTVTLNYRERREDGEHARVFWPAGESWVDAEPARAADGVVEKITASALEGWDVPQQLVYDAGVVNAVARQAEGRVSRLLSANDRPGAGFEMR